MERPPLTKLISLTDFNDFYWLKEELVDFCKTIGINTSGGKFEVAKKIQLYLLTGEITQKAIKNPSQQSKFDWNSEPLSLQTPITDNYKNTENVRAFFTTQIGANFTFNVSFMNWMKTNSGKTLKEAIEEWKRIKTISKDKNHITTIDPQFEYNTYMRAFLADNPTSSSKDAMRFWKLKRAKRGTNVYERTDLNLA